MCSDLRLTTSLYLVYDVGRDEVLWSSKDKRKKEVASITKVMTFYTAWRCLKRLKLDCNRLDQIKFEVSKNAGNKCGTTANLKEGD